MTARTMAARIADARDVAEVNASRAAGYVADVALQLSEAEAAAGVAALELERTKAARASLAAWDEGVGAADTALVGATVARDLADATIPPLRDRHKAAVIGQEQADAWATVCRVAQERERRIAAMLPLATTARGAVVDLAALLSERWPGINSRTAAAVPGSQATKVKGLLGSAGAHESERKAAAKMADSLSKIQQHLESSARALSAVFPD